MDALDELLKVKKAEIKVLKVSLKKLIKEKADVQYINKVERQINSLEWYVHRFRKAAMHPVKIDGIVINFKLYERFIKKLKGFNISQEVKDGQLVINYSNKVSKGMLTLEDITSHFPDVSKIQDGELYAVL
jgi:hypothetical protein